MSTKAANIKQKKFSSKCFFSNTIPYDPFFSERIPFLQCIQLAIAQYQQTHYRERYWYLKKRRPFIAVECGVYVGASLLALSNSLKDAGISHFHIHAFDTFEGLPELSDKEISLAPVNAPYLTKTVFADTSLEEVKKVLCAENLMDAIYLHKGLFKDTMPLLPNIQYDFVNIDCDLYESHMTCLHSFYPRMRKGGIMFFDDYYSKEYPMAKVAIDEFMKDKPEQLLHLRFGKEETNHTKVYLVKYDE